MIDDLIDEAVVYVFDTVDELDEIPGTIFDAVKDAAAKIQGKLVEVGGHFRDGKWIPKHFRTWPDGNPNNNLGSWGLGNK